MKRVELSSISVIERVLLIVVLCVSFFGVFSVEKGCLLGYYVIGIFSIININRRRCYNKTIQRVAQWALSCDKNDIQDQISYEVSPRVIF